MHTEKDIIENADFATKAIQIYIIKRKIRNKETGALFNELIELLRSTVILWTGHTNIGIPKSNLVKESFQNFYTNFMKLLLIIKDDPSAAKEEISFANSILYQGKIYRYLGTRKNKRHKPIEPIYDNVYVSWSTEEKSTCNMNEKLVGTKTLLSTEIIDDYGINLDYFDLVQQKVEKEVIYPTKKESKINIKYIK